MLIETFHALRKTCLLLNLFVVRMHHIDYIDLTVFIDRDQLRKTILKGKGNER